MVRKHLTLLPLILSPCLCLGAYPADTYAADAGATGGTPLIVAEATLPLPPATTADLQRQARELFGPLPPAMAGGGTDTPYRISLGRELFNNKYMSATGTHSCSSCHPLDGRQAGADNLPVPKGALGQTSNRNTPTLLNAGFQMVLNRDGGYPTLDLKATVPILDNCELGMMDESAVMERLDKVGYRPAFAAAFQGEGEPFRFANVGRALAAYGRTLRSPARFDRFMEGEAQALTALEQRGLQQFIAVGCAGCHTGSLVGGGKLEKLGVYHPYPSADEGLARVTKRAEDQKRFKVPPLRNAVLSAPYFHDGQVASLPEAIDLAASIQLNRQLSGVEIESILRFMVALSDERRTTAPTGGLEPMPATAQAINPTALPSDQEVADAIRYGYALVTETYRYLGQAGTGNSRNSMACSNCHQGAGTKPYGFSWIGVAKGYPRPEPRTGNNIRLADKVNACLMRNHNGSPLAAGSREMSAMLAYLNWLSADAFGGVATPRIPEFYLPRKAADAQQGEKVYRTFCQGCHGANGAGYLRQAANNRPELIVPPLWGAGSYSDGASMHRVLTATGFIRGNMPLGTPFHQPALTVRAAYDVAAYVNSQERPQFAARDRDWPNLAHKPVDAPFAPWADPFTQQQHKYGPHRPILDWYLQTATR